MNSNKSLAPYLFHQGINYRAYEYLGVHKEREGYVFRVWAPRAEKVFLVGDFNCWEESIGMVKLTDGGIWEVFIDNGKACLGDKYKYKIYGGGEIQYKADPFCTVGAALPETASLLGFDDAYKWRDSGWMLFRKRYAQGCSKLPLNIYELHAGSWKRHEDGSYFDFEELARELAPYVKQMGYTHVQLTSAFGAAYYGLGDCPCFFGAAEHGGNSKLKRFVDCMHEAGVGVIFELELSRFANTPYGLARFDGVALYERADTACDGDGLLELDLGRNEVKSFLFSVADHRLRRLHADGLSITCDFSGGSSHSQAEFLRRLSLYIKREFCDAILIANPRSEADASMRSFDIIADKGWTNETLAYASVEPCYRKYNHSKLNFSMTYAFEQTHLLAISHKDVSAGRLSFIDKMAGDYWQKFANARAYLGYMMTHPGKKLSFMGNEIGQFREWERDNETECFLLEYETHAKFQRYVAELNHIYLGEPALWSEDDSWHGFEWIEPDDAAQSILSYKRIANDSSEVLVLINFTPTVYRRFLLGTDREGIYREVFNSDDSRFGGSGVLNSGLIKTTGIPISRCKNSIEINVPPLAAVIFKAE